MIFEVILIAVLYFSFNWKRSISYIYPSPIHTHIHTHSGTWHTYMHAHVLTSSHLWRQQYSFAKNLKSLVCIHFSLATLHENQVYNISFLISPAVRLIIANGLRSLIFLWLFSTVSQRQNPYPYSNVVL